MRNLRWLDAVLPPVCVVCEAPVSDADGGVCRACWWRAPELRGPRCTRCGIPLRDIGLVQVTSSCLECREWMPYLRSARSVFRMEGTAAAMIHALKYGGWTCHVERLGQRMAEVRFEAAVEAELGAIVFVPLSARRRRERGFNQAELLAEVVGRARGRRVLEGALERRRHTRPQARLSPRERIGNVANAFVVRPGWARAVEEIHILLIDDVLTTGATALACTRALVAAGARAVSVLTFARARPMLSRTLSDSTLAA